MLTLILLLEKALIDNVHGLPTSVFLFSEKEISILFKKIFLLFVYLFIFFGSMSFVDKPDSNQ